MSLNQAVQTRERKLRRQKGKAELSLIENGQPVSLSAAAMASDAVDSALFERLGPPPDEEAQGLASGGARPAARRSGGTAARTVRAGAKRKATAPLASEIVDPLAGTLGLVTLFLGLLLCGFNLEDPLVDTITMDQEESHAIAQPLANILSRQKWFTEYGHLLVHSEDGIALAYALILYGVRVVPAIRERLGSRPSRGQRAPQTTGIPAASRPAGNGAYHGDSSDHLAGLSGAYLAE